MTRTRRDFFAKFKSEQVRGDLAMYTVSEQRSLYFYQGSVPEKILCEAPETRSFYNVRDAYNV